MIVMKITYFFRTCDNALKPNVAAIPSPNIITCGRYFIEMKERFFNKVDKKFNLASLYGGYRLLNKVKIK